MLSLGAKKCKKWGATPAAAAPRWRRQGTKVFSARPAPSATPSSHFPGGMASQVPVERERFAGISISHGSG